MRRVRESQRGIEVEGGEGKKNGIGVNNTTERTKDSEKEIAEPLAEEVGRFFC